MTLHHPPVPCFPQWPPPQWQPSDCHPQWHPSDCHPPQWQPDDCGCDPGWGSLQRCWNEIGQFKLLLADIINSMSFVSSATTGAIPPANPQKGMLWLSPSGELMVYDGHEWVSVKTGLPAGTVGGGTPLVGVTDGSNAMPGDVGEFITGESTTSLTPAQVFQADVSPLIVPPGDWLLYASVEGRLGLGGSWWFVKNSPPGLSNGMQGSVGGTEGVVVGQPARGSFTVATPLVFVLNVTNLDAANLVIFKVEGWRMR